MKIQEKNLEMDLIKYRNNHKTMLIVIKIKKPQITTQDQKPLTANTVIAYICKNYKI